METHKPTARTSQYRIIGTEKKKTVSCTPCISLREAFEHTHTDHQRYQILVLV